MSRQRKVRRKYGRGRMAIAIDDNTGFEVKHKDLVRQWDGLYTLPENLDRENPFFRPRKLRVGPNIIRNPRPDKVKPTHLIDIWYNQHTGLTMNAVLNNPLPAPQQVHENVYYFYSSPSLNKSNHPALANRQKYELPDNQNSWNWIVPTLAQDEYLFFAQHENAPRPVVNFQFEGFQPNQLSIFEADGSEQIDGETYEVYRTNATAIAANVSGVNVTFAV